MPDFSNPEHEMFTGRRPRAFQFNCCVGTAILGQALAGRKTFGEIVSTDYADSLNQSV
jgi:hypothetical protein